MNAENANPKHLNPERMPPTSGDGTTVKYRSASKIANLEYIRQMLLELRMIAKGEGTLAYLLEISAMEASECIKTHIHKSELAR